MAIVDDFEDIAERLHQLEHPNTLLTLDGQRALDSINSSYGIGPGMYDLPRMRAENERKRKKLREVQLRIDASNPAFSIEKGQIIMIDSQPYECIGIHQAERD